jgi:hypothetical protein
MSLNGLATIGMRDITDRPSTHPIPPPWRIRYLDKQNVSGNHEAFFRAA